jgi:hypothetical protein
MASLTNYGMRKIIVTIALATTTIALIIGSVTSGADIFMRHRAEHEDGPLASAATYDPPPPARSSYIETKK